MPKYTFHKVETIAHEYTVEAASEAQAFVAFSEPRPAGTTYAGSAQVESELVASFPSRTLPELVADLRAESARALAIVTAHDQPSTSAN